MAARAGVIGTDLGRLRRLVRAAPDSPKGWQTFLDSLSSVLHCGDANLMIRERSLGIVSAVSVGIDPQQVKAYLSYYHERDPLVAPFLASPGGTIHLRQELVDEHELRRTEYYNDFLKPNRIEHLCAVHILPAPSCHGWISITRPPDRRDFDAGDVALLKELVPDLEEAASRFCRQALVPDVLRAFPGALDGLPCGVVILDCEGWILYANPAALAMLADNDGIRSERGKLDFADPMAVGHLRSVADHRTTKGPSDRLRIELEFSAARPSGELPYRVLVSPAPDDDNLARGSGDHSPATLLFVEDLGADAARSRTLFQGRYGLTNAEIEVIGDLVEGRTLEEIATARTVSVETVRTQLKSVYRKTDTTSQAQLVALFYRVTRVMRLA